MTPAEATAYRKDDKPDRIGGPTRDKWVSFLQNALEREYITPPEFDERVAGVMAAVTMSDVWDAIALSEWDLDDITGWNHYWHERRKAGLERVNSILPAIQSRPRRRYLRPAFSLFYLIVSFLAGFGLALILLLGS